MVGKTPDHLQNSADLVIKLSQIRVDEDESLISFDVSALFTIVGQPKATFTPNPNISDIVLSLLIIHHWGGGYIMRSGVV